MTCVKNKRQSLTGEIEVTAEGVLYALSAPQSYVLEFHSASPPAEVNSWYEMQPEERRQEILARVEECLSEQMSGQPRFIYPSREWYNVYYHRGYGLLPVSPEHLGLSTICWTEEPGCLYDRVMFVLNVMRQLLVTNSRTTKRDIYYQNVAEFSSQVMLDRVVAIIASALQVREGTNGELSVILVRLNHELKIEPLLLYSPTLC